MNDKLNKATVLVLNRNWQAINIRTPQDAFCQMATNVATALEETSEALRPHDSRARRQSLSINRRVAASGRRQSRSRVAAFARWPGHVEKSGLVEQRRERAQRQSPAARSRLEIAGRATRTEGIAGFGAHS